ncbi:MAG: folate-binding protein, partial [Aldersonia sp.]|nr:folate-binding protein [Aldersonia sp.]
MPVTPSPILGLPRAVPGPEDTPEAAVAWHFGDPLREQRAAVERVAVIDRSHRFVIAIGGPERLSWLHTVSSQHIADMRDGDSAENLSLDANGRVEHHFVLTDLDGTVWLDTESDTGPALLGFLQKMVFWAKAEPRDGNDHAVLSLLGPQAREVLPNLPSDDYRATPLPELSGGSAGSARAGGFVRKMAWPTPDSYELVVPRAQLTEVWQRLVDRGATPAG